MEENKENVVEETTQEQQDNVVKVDISKTNEETVTISRRLIYQSRLEVKPKKFKKNLLKKQLTKKNPLKKLTRKTLNNLY